MVEVVEAYKDFAPAFDVRSAVEDLLVSLKPRQLTGLRRIVLTNSATLTGARKRAWTRSRGRKARHREALGLYHQAWRGEHAWIELFVDNITAGSPRWVLRFRVLRNLLIGSTLFHELGHHIHRCQRPEHREGEDIAEEWASRLSYGYLAGRHRLTWLILSSTGRLVRWSRRVLRAIFQSVGIRSV